MQIDTTLAHLLLKRELLARQKKNPKYSIRRFSSHLKIDASLLIKLLKGHRIVTNALAKKIEVGLNLTPGVLERPNSNNLEAKLKRPTIKLSWSDCEMFMSTWRAQAMLVRCSSGDFNGNCRLLADEFGAPLSNAKAIFTRLLALGIVKKTKANQYDGADIILGSDEKDLTRRELAQTKLQKSYLQHMQQILDSKKSTPKMMSSICASLNPHDLPILENLLALHQARVCEQMDQLAGKNRRDIYAIQFNLIPLSKENRHDY